MTAATDPYDEMPYRSMAIRWTAPEHLALTSMLHDGPRVGLERYRVLELGCGNGGNLLPMAYYRRNGTFLGIDAAGGPIALAQARAKELGLEHVAFLAADFRAAADILDGRFDFIIAHGVCSWIPAEVLDALLALCARALRPGGLTYLNYNARPGWDVRGLVRGFLLAQTEGIRGLPARAEAAHEVAAGLAALLEASPRSHPYAQLLANEFRFVGQNHVSHVAHEYLATDNHAFWRSEFLGLAARHGLEHVADADFRDPSNRVPEGLADHLRTLRWTGRSTEDTVDLLCYRQMHSPLLTVGPWERTPPSPEDLGALHLASCLIPEGETDAGGDGPTFRHPTGLEVVARDAAIASAFRVLRPLWPRGLPINALFPEPAEVLDDLRLLHRHGLIELRLPERPDVLDVPRERLNRLEMRWSGCATTPHHEREAATAGA